MDADDFDRLNHRRKGAVFYLSLLLVLWVTWLLFSQAFTYSWVQTEGAHATGKVEGLAQPASLAPVMKILSCHEISYEDHNKTARRFSVCRFDASTHETGEQVKVIYAGDDAIIDDTMIAIRSGLAASFWLMLSMGILFRRRR